MLQIRITQPIIRMAEEYAATVFDGVKPSPKDRLKSLKTSLATMRYSGSKPVKEYQNYIQSIIDHYDEILVLQPQLFTEKRKTWFKMLDESDLSIKFGKKSFADRVSNAMLYGDKVREKMRGYYIQLGIRTCVYCNAQYAATFVRTDGRIKSQYQIDHNFPQSKYPFLCTSFFNLIPSCSTCNLSRGERYVKFRLYNTNGSNLKPFKFHIPIGSLVEYSLSKNVNNIEINLISNIRRSKPYQTLINHQERFHIDEIYKFFRQEASDVIRKSEIFDQHARRMLTASLHSPVTQSQADSLILGFDVSESKIHNAPLTMMRQDIAREIGIL